MNQIEKIIPRFIIYTGWKQQQYKKEFFDKASIIFKQYYKALADEGCQMSWQGLDEEVSNLDNSGYIQEKRGCIFVLCENTQNFSYKKSEIKNGIYFGLLETDLNPEDLIGCIALRQLPFYDIKTEDPEINNGIDIQKKSELKRLYVKPGYQKCGLGGILMTSLIEKAQELQYDEMYLDSLDRLTKAKSLYLRLGFHQINQYNVNPEHDAIYLKKQINLQMVPEYSKL